MALPSKGGIRSTEFWLALLVMALDSGATVAGILPGETGAKVMAWIAIGYMVVRTFRKTFGVSGDAPAPAQFGTPTDGSAATFGTPKGPTP